MDAEEQRGCELCSGNRKMLEKAWQIVANEYFDPRGEFSQSGWARQLLLALQVRSLMVDEFELPGTGCDEICGTAAVRRSPAHKAGDV